MMRKKVSIIIPVYNEEKNLIALFEQLCNSIVQLDNFDFEIIFVNDGSKDSSWATINQLAQRYSFVKGINFSRNFGHQIALSAGYDFATGDIMITMDADLQHPPHMIPNMIEKWQEGYAVVYVKSNTRNDRFFKKITALSYYRILHAMVHITIPRNVADFRLIDKKVAYALRKSKEKHRYLRGMVAWAGFKHIVISCQFGERLSGVSGYTWKKMLKLAFDGLTSFAHFPLRIASYIASVIIIIGIICFLILIYNACLYTTQYSLFKWLLTFIYISMGIQFFLSCLVGELVSRMYDTSKHRPLYIISETFNIIEEPAV